MNLEAALEARTDALPHRYRPVGPGTRPDCHRYHPQGWFARAGCQPRRCLQVRRVPRPHPPGASRPLRLLLCLRTGRRRPGGDGFRAETTVRSQPSFEMRGQRAGRSGRRGGPNPRASPPAPPESAGAAGGVPSEMRSGSDAQPGGQGQIAIPAFEIGLTRGQPQGSDHEERFGAQRRLPVQPSGHARAGSSQPGRSLKTTLDSHTPGPESRGFSLSDRRPVSPSYLVVRSRIRRRRASRDAPYSRPR